MVCCLAVGVVMEISATAKAKGTVEAVEARRAGGAGGAGGARGAGEVV